MTGGQVSHEPLLRLNPDGMAPPAGLYSQGVLAPLNAQWLHISGQIGVDAGGNLAADFDGQAVAAWKNLFAVLRAAGMDASHLVKVTTFLTDASHLPRVGPIRSRFLQNARPASTLLIVPALARPEWQVEIEAVACRP